MAPRSPTFQKLIIILMEIPYKAPNSNVYLSTFENTIFENKYDFLQQSSIFLFYIINLASNLSNYFPNNYLSNNLIENAYYPICLEIIKVKRIINCCSHIYCFTCIKKWSRIKSIFPICRRKIISIQKKTKYI